MKLRISSQNNLKLFQLHDMLACEGGGGEGMALLSHNLRPRCQWMVNARPRPHDLRESSPVPIIEASAWAPVPIIEESAWAPVPIIEEAAWAPVPIMEEAAWAPVPV
jgi:hypothetical protein